MYDDLGHPGWREHRSGAWTVVGTCGLLVAVALTRHGYDRLLPALGDFFTGDIAGLRSHGGSPADLLVVMSAAIPLMLAAAAVLAVAVSVVYGLPGDYSFSVEDALRVPGNRFPIVIMLLTVEELYARWLFLGLLSKPFSGSVAFYVLFFVGNGTWALLHLRNFRDPADRRVPRVLPHFVGGTAMTVIYVNFGLVGAILVHVGYDMVVFCADRKDAFGVVGVLSLGWNATAAGFSWLFFDESLRDVGRWLSNAPSLELPGWSPVDYVWMTIFVTSAAGAVAQLLLYDEEPPPIPGGAFSRLLGAMLQLSLLYGVFALLGLFTDRTLPRVLAIALLAMFAVPSASGSGLAKIFWFRVPALMTTVFSALALSFWQGVFLLFAMSWAGAPDQTIRSLRARPDRLEG